MVGEVAMITTTSMSEWRPESRDHKKSHVRRLSFPRTREFKFSQRTWMPACADTSRGTDRAFKVRKGICEIARTENAFNHLK